MDSWQIIAITLGIILFYVAGLGVFWASNHLDGDYAPVIRKFSVFCLIAGSLVAAFQLTKFFYHF